MHLRSPLPAGKSKLRQSAKPSSVGPAVPAKLPARGQQRGRDNVLCRYKVADEGPLLPDLGSMLETPSKGPKAEAPAQPQPQPQAPPQETPQPGPPKLEVQAPEPPAEPSGPAADASAAMEDLNSKMGSAGEQAAGLQQSLDQSLSGIQGTASQFTEQLGKEVNLATGGVTRSLEGVLGGASSSVDSATKATQAAIDQAAAQAQALSDQLAAAANSTTKGATDAFDEATASAYATASTYLQGAEQSLEATRDQVYQSLPPEAQAVLLQAGEISAEGVKFAQENPMQAAIIGGVVVGPLTYTYYNTRYGGYAGELSPLQVQELLAAENSNALLVDVRSDELRERDGVLELKFDARFKAAALPVSYAQAQVNAIDVKVLKQIESREKLVEAVHAAFIANLAKIETPAMCRVVIMDQKGTDSARNLARALRQEGVPMAYVMKGGFARWVKDGLPVEKKSDYEAGQIDVLADNLEVVAARAARLATRLRDPQVALPVGSTTAGLSVALYNYHTTLEVIGLLGLCWSLYTKLESYDSPQAALSDAQRSIQQVVRLLSGANLRKPAQPAQASSPSSGTATTRTEETPKPKPASSPPQQAPAASSPPSPKPAAATTQLPGAQQKQPQQQQQGAPTSAAAGAGSSKNEQ